MPKQVTLKIKSIQKTKGEEEQVIELLTEAEFYQKENMLFLRYEESELSGIDGAMTQLEIQDHLVKMRRVHSGVTEMLFEENKRSISEYHTPYGKFKLESLTRQLKVTYSPHLIVEIEYDISLQSTFESTNLLYIEVLAHGS